MLDWLKDIVNEVKEESRKQEKERLAHVQATKKRREVERQQWAKKQKACSRAGHKWYQSESYAPPPSGRSPSKSKPKEIQFSCRECGVSKRVTIYCAKDEFEERKQFGLTEGYKERTCTEDGHDWKRTVLRPKRELDDGRVTSHREEFVCKRCGCKSKLVDTSEH